MGRLKHQVKFFLDDKRKKFQNKFVIENKLSPASEASKEVENFDWRKKHTPICIWCQGIRHSVCLSVTKFDPNYLWTG